MSEPGARSPLGPRCASEAGGDPGSGPGRDARTVGARDRIARYAGLVGALLLAVAGYLGGALPDADTAPDGGPLTVTLWLLGTIAMVGAWWALRAGAPSTRWAYVTAGWWALPLLVTAPLGSRDVYSYACQGWIYADGGDPYAIGVAWRDTPAPYGPFFVLLAALAVTLGGGLVGTVVLLRPVCRLGGRPGCCWPVRWSGCTWWPGRTTTR